MRPGQTLRLEHVVRNTGADPIPVTQATLESLLDRGVWLGAGNPVLPLLELHTPSPLAAGHHIPAGASVRVCLEFRVPDPRLDAFAGNERDGAFRLVQLGDALWVETRYRPERGNQREPTSWGGIVQLILADGADLLEICRQEGLRAGMGNASLRHREGGGDPYPGAVWVQVPRDRSVATAVAQLRRRPDVQTATSVERGDPGAEGCGPHSPCDPGHVCCYPCGIAGCANSCFAGSTCPTRMP